MPLMRQSPTSAAGCFDSQVLKKQIGIAVSQWDDFMCRMRALTEQKVQ